MQYTAVPNVIFDRYLANLKLIELKVLLVIIRKTQGYVDYATGGRKEEAWISRSEFSKHTGISQSYVSKAIDALFTMGLINVKGDKDIALETAQQRQFQKRLVFSCVLFATNKSSESSLRQSELLLEARGTKAHPIKEKERKEIKGEELSRLRMANAHHSIKPLLEKPEPPT